jgi:hypothetical protein
MTPATQATAELKDKADSLFSLFEKANITVVEVFRQLETRDVAVPQTSLEQYDQALLLADDAQSLIQVENYSEANARIIQALQRFREAIRIVYTTIPHQPTEIEIVINKAAQLESSINRYYEQMQQVRNLTSLAATVGYNTTMLETKIQIINSQLDNALSNVNQNRFEAASKNLAEVKTLCNQLMRSISNFAADLKIQRIETYINQTQERLGAIRETAESLSNENSLIALNNAETSLNKAKEYLEEQQIDETLSELATSKASEEEAVNHLKLAAASFEATSSETLNTVQPP